MDHLFINVVGYFGSALLILAYLLNSLKKIEGDSLAYQGLNFTGTVLMMANSWYFGAMPSVIINVFWIGIGIFAVSRYLKRRNSRPSPL
jgi:uncharacterized membrane protein